MVPDVSRRLLVTGLVGTIGTGALGFTTYKWQEYSYLHSTRNHLRFRNLRGVNLSDEPAPLHVTVTEDGARVYDRTYELEASGNERDERNMSGPWVKSSGEYSIRVELDDDEFALEHAEIIDRLEGQRCQGSDDVEVVIRLTEERAFESDVSIAN